ncbi:cytochrome P450 [Epidermidibacterium keratini]|uniref:Cytochrome P450 n=1 Tax=Epidermidibacterium keratini TaxID=1891644 RepID=A0A7L4YMJ9_9ACTN|nr:cytochrome P450 [Epidermidibacterium keratini]QHC00370.1 cytochrome P450 [Epidermidibacterium keratini]
MSPTAAPGTERIHDPQTYVTGAPLDVIDELREQAPVVWVDEPATADFDGGPGYWLVLRHADVQSVLTDPATYSSHLGATQVRDPATSADLSYVQRMMLNMDPPDHGRLRRPLQKSFTARAVLRLEEQIAAHVSGILDRSLKHDEPVDFAKEIAADLPLLTLADVLGVPPEDRMLMFDWSNRVIGFQDPDYATSAAFDPSQGSEIARAALMLRPEPDADGRMPDPRSRSGMPDLYDYAHRLGELKQRDPGSDVMSILMSNTHGDDGAISVEEFENMFWLFAVAGNETLRNGLPGGMYALLQHPDSQRRLREEPELMDSAIEEMLRWWTPVMVFRRTATTETSLADQQIDAGQKVVVSFLSANRDPRVFDKPEQFRIDRGAREHLVFGHGPHFCLGAHLARVQMRQMFTQLLERTSWMEAAGEPALLRSSFQRGIKRLPVRFAAA